MVKTLLDFIQKEPEPIVHCHQRKTDVPLKTCLEKCITNRCMDSDQIVKLQKHGNTVNRQ